MSDSVLLSRKSRVIVIASVDLDLIEAYKYGVSSDGKRCINNCGCHICRRVHAGPVCEMCQILSAFFDLQ